MALPLAPHLTVVAVPAAVLAWGDGTYGISYDMSTGSIERDSPGGWNMYRSQVYRNIRRHLTNAGFAPEQYSVWHSNTSGATSWQAMLQLRNLRPWGVFPSTMRRLEMFQIRSNVLIVTPHVQLGGMWSRRLLGPTPVGLLPMVPLAVAPVAVGGGPGWLPPQYVKRRGGAMNPGNWVR